MIVMQIGLSTVWCLNTTEQLKVIGLPEDKSIENVDIKFYKIMIVRIG